MLRITVAGVDSQAPLHLIQELKDAVVIFTTPSKGPIRTSWLHVPVRFILWCCSLLSLHSSSNAAISRSQRRVLAFCLVCPRQRHAIRQRCCA